jgi:hypothetical protein
MSPTGSSRRAARSSFAGLRQLHAATVAQQQRLAQLNLQRAHLALRDGWATPSTKAALLKLPCSATWTKVSSWVSFIESLSHKPCSVCLLASVFYALLDRSSANRIHALAFAPIPPPPSLNIRYAYP